MIKKTALMILCLFFWLTSKSQESFTIDWLYDDISQYSTYTISKFSVNDELVDYAARENSARFIALFNKNMKKMGLTYDSAAVLSANFAIRLDTLAVGFQRLDGIRSEDRILDFTLTLIDQEVNEKLLVANLNTLPKGPKKLDKELKRILKVFFDEVKLNGAE